MSDVGIDLTPRYPPGERACKLEATAACLRSSRTQATTEPFGAVGESVLANVSTQEEGMMAHRRLLLLMAVSAGLALALLPTTAPANPVAGDIAFVGNGELLIGSVDVTLRYSCLPPSPGGLVVRLDEGGTAFGINVDTPATCDGKSHTVTVNVPGPFTPGIATGTAEVFNLDAQATADTNQKVAIK
jgi:hypothetical protein